MPTNLKSLLTRSRSKNELKLRESKDEISPAGNSESSNGESGGDDSVSCANGNGRCSEQQVKDDECCRGCCRQRSESPLDLGSNATTKAVLRSYSSENNCFPSNDISYNSDSYSKSDESPPALSSSSSCSYSDENFIKSLNCTTGPATGCGGTLSTMLPPGNSFHHQQQHPQGPYQCCSQHKSYSNGGGGGGLPYEMIPGIGGAPAVSGDVSSPLDYSGYFLDEKSNSIMDRRDDGEREMRLNSNRTLFLSCNALHQPSCATSFESSGHMDTPPPPLPISTEFPATHVSSSLISGGSGAAVSASLHHHQQQHQIGPSFRTRTGAVDGCGSMACELPSAAPSCCTYNSKEGFPPANSQGLTMRKCETVLALSSLNNGTISTTTSPLTATTSNGNKSSSSYARNSGGLTNFAKFPGGAVPVSSLTSSGSTTMSHLSASSGGGASSSGSNVGGKVRVMKEKILSTSSSALNCLLHSSSRTGKLLSGWKLSSGASSSSNGGSSLNVGHMFGGSSEGSNCLGGNCQSSKHFLGVSSSSSATAANESNKLGSAATSHQHHPHKSRSQLSISENSFSSSPAPLTPVNRLRRNVSVNNTNSFCPTSGGSLSAHSSYSRSSSVSSFAGWKEKDDPFEQNLFCRLCLSYVRLEETMEIVVCKCRYCKDCLISYVSFEITEGADEIACPDASCEKQGVLGMQEVEQLVSPVLIEKHKKFKLFREVEKDNKLMWCPSPGCETVCQIQTGNGILTGGYIPEIDRAHGGPVVVAPSGGGSRSLPFIQCHTCHKTHCANCKLSWHPDSSCESFRRKLIKQGKLTVEDDELFSLDSIKKCPFCHVPIEKDSGCAQMMCKRCKHVFCWYCLASLDDDFLLRHYDKGPCKNKLGHSRASVVWHRAQVIGIFAGFGVLVLLASPLLILAAPCLLCCRCRYCANKLDPEESDLV